MPFTPPTRRQVLGAGLFGFALSSSASGEPIPLAPPDKQPAGLPIPKPPERTTGWAIVGLGELALGEILPAFAQTRTARPVALVSGHPDKAAKVAAAYGIDPKRIYSYDTFDRLADDKAVDIVYVVLPNSMHAEFTERAFKAGKHVLCEKPMAVSVAEGQGMIAAAKAAGRKLMIAYRLRYEPHHIQAIELVRKLGGARTISASNCQDTQAPNIRLSRALGGGPLGDIGIYCLNAARYLTGAEPVEVTAQEHRPTDVPRFREVPESVAFTLRFPSGAVAALDCSFNSVESRRLRVHCPGGVIDMENAFAYRGLEMTVFEKAGRRKLTLGQVNHFAAEMDHFSDCVLRDRPPRTPGEEGLADLRVIAALNEAARTGRAVKVG